MLAELSGDVEPSNRVRPGVEETNYYHFGRQIHFDDLVHFVAITGVCPDTQQVWVADPWPGGDSVEFTFEDFLSRYYFANNRNGAVEVLDSVVNRSLLKHS